jgi:hypothetical protein
VISSQTCPAQRQVSFASCLIERPRFVATKKMTLLSGNPDGFQLLKDKDKEQQINDLLPFLLSINSVR